MWTRIIQYGKLIAFLSLACMCRKPYDVPAFKTSLSILSIDGMINTGAAKRSVFLVSRSVNLSDSLPYKAELNARVQIKDISGNTFQLTDSAFNGVYVSDPLTLDANSRFQLSVISSDGKKYLSDFVSPKTAPAIDSIYWQLNDDAVLGTQVINVYLDAHDPSNNNAYYRWDYEETWLNRSRYESKWKVIGDSIYPLSPENELYNCWKYNSSSDILLGSTINLSSSVVSRKQIARFLKNDSKMDVEYSTQVRQYPLDEAAYKYWLTISQNAQNPGSFFDFQPNQLAGNIHCVSNPNDPVIGYVSASTIAEKRIFIRNSQLPGWQSNFAGNCPLDSFPTNPLNTLRYNFADTSLTIYEFLHGSIIPLFPGTIILTKKPCVDCRFQGGSVSKPDYWMD
jgi:Domain of unknown function (DUF4249)